jgi:hypothetical protein
MIRIARMIGFTFSAIGVQIASGVGLAALVAAFALGCFHARIAWLLATTLLGAGAAVWLFEDVSTGGKVVNAQSNVVFVLFVYALISIVGYALGRLARRLR